MSVSSCDAFRESVTPQNLEQIGLDPHTFETSLPVSGRLAVTHKSVWAGEEGMFSLGTAQRATTDVTYNYSSSGSFKLFRDAAAVRSVLGSSGSTAIKLGLDQGFGAGDWAGKVSFVHENTSGEATASVGSSSSLSAINLALGLGASTNLSASAMASESSTAAHVATQKQDFVLTRAGTAIAEYHHADVTTNGSAVETSQMAFRTPTVNLAEVGTFSASHVRNESSATGTESINTFNLTASPSDAVQVNASHMLADRPAGHETVSSANLSAKHSDKVDITASLLDASRPAGDESLLSATLVARPSDSLMLSASHTSSAKPGVPDTEVTDISSSFKATDGMTVAAKVNSTETDGAGTTTVTSVDVVAAPGDGTGFGLKAGFVDTSTPLADTDPTVRLQLDYTTTDSLMFTGSYRQANGLVAPELLSSLSTPVWGGKLSASYTQKTTTPNVVPSRGMGAEYTRPIGWGLEGKVGYARTTNLLGPELTAWKVHGGFAGKNNLLGQVDLQCTNGTVRNPLGSVSSSTAVALSMARPIDDLGTCSLSLKHTATELFPDDEQVRLDVSVAW